MRRRIAVLIAVLLFIVMLAACSKSFDKLTVAELLDIGEKYLLEMNYEQAIVYFERLIEIEQMNPRGYTGLATAYVGKGDYSNAISVLQSGVEKLSDNDFLREVIIIYEKIIDEAPANPDTYIGLANLYISLGDDEKAIEVLRRGIEHLPNSIEIQKLLENLTAVDSIALPGMPVDFSFASGAGAWSTEVTVNSDGSFFGYYHDSDMGDIGEGYPNGTRYECYFNGKFINVQKISDHEYSMNVEFISIEGTDGETKIVDGVKIISSEPYGFDNADDFRLYLPGRQTNDLPEAFIDWVCMPMAWNIMPDTLPFFGLYNVGGEQGFFSSVIVLDTESPQQTPTPTVGNNTSAPVEVFQTMSKSEHKELHMFFSNFVEVGMSSFDANNYSDDELITFAIWHTYQNNQKSISYSVNNEIYSSKISSETVSAAVERYFGIRVKHKSVEYIDNPNYWNYGQYTYLYEDGYYYFMAADGEPLCWAQVTALNDNHDGTYTAYFDTYSSHFAPDNLYEDISDWNLNTEYGTIRVYKKGDDTLGADYFEAVVYSRSYVAEIKPYNNNGRASYQLLSLR